MPSLRDFLTTVERRDAGGHKVVLQTPLTADASRPDVGWLTRITFVRGPLGVTRGRPVAKVRRITTSVRHTPSDLRRVFKDRPYTTEQVVIYPGRVVSTTSTRWDWLWTSAATTTYGLSFNLADLEPLLAGVIESGEGRPLADWLVENTTEFAVCLTQPGWLPGTIEEFEAVRLQRAPAALDYGEEDDGEDRWR